MCDFHLIFSLLKDMFLSFISVGKMYLENLWCKYVVALQY